ncbi:hypothetical protein EDM57_04765 [Brevibacillus gelatini]|uniref:Uncharacterized protein n=1 Tax=Brevibacillus gelatini TaxID=1655277 RepID=A0A3M8B7Q9_9BACL|nr:hypothetical protein [Brevibacillus gelatini]RNB59458.1 hypothetical protein EDM57_04765 [Brevibacillus gelatini]
MNFIKSIKGNVITADFQKIDPSVILNKDCLDIFYETVSEIEQYGKVTTKEWNSLIGYIKQLDYQYDDFTDEKMYYLNIIN